MKNNKTAAENVCRKEAIESGKKKQKLNNVVLAIQISQKKVSRKSKWSMIVGIDISGRSSNSALLCKVWLY